MDLMVGDSDSFTLDVYRFRDELRRAYQAAPGPAGAAVVLGWLQEQYNLMLELYEDYVHLPMVAGTGLGRSRVKRRQMERLFRPWQARARRFGRRLDAYWGDACLPRAPCPDVAQPSYTNAWVAAPVLDGQWPAEYYLGLQDTPPHPDAVEFAMLWNQLVAVKDVVDNLGDSADQLAIELWERLAGELRVSLPGEEPTFRDAINEALNRLREGLDGLWEGFKDAAWYIGAGLAVLLGGWFAWKARR